MAAAIWCRLGFGAASRRRYGGWVDAVRDPWAARGDWGCWAVLRRWRQAVCFFCAAAPRRQLGGLGRPADRGALGRPPAAPGDGHAALLRLDAAPSGRTRAGAGSDLRGARLAAPRVRATG